MKTPHKHANIIKAWADGAEIQVYDASNEAWHNSQAPIWDAGLKYRIKPEPKPDVVYYGVYEEKDVHHRRSELEFCFTQLNDHGDQIKLTFDGETGKLKTAEVL